MLFCSCIVLLPPLSRTRTPIHELVVWTRKYLGAAPKRVMLCASAAATPNDKNLRLIHSKHSFMKLLKKLGSVMVLAAALVSGCNSDSPDGPDNTENQLSLSVNKNIIMPNGRDEATFTVKFGSTDVSASAKITDQNGNELSGNSFSSKVEGSYTFTAYYTSQGVDYTSNTVTVEVSGNMILSVDAETIATGESATFSLIYQDTDVSASASITNLTTKEKLTSNVFNAPSYTGTFEFQATYAGMTSNVVTVTVEAARATALRLVQSKALVKEGDQVDFQVLFEGKDVTSEAAIINVTSGEELSGHSFTCQNRGTFKFQAHYNDQKSQTVTVSTGSFYKKVQTLKFTSVQCGQCVQTSVALENANKSYPDRMVMVASYMPSQGDDPFALPGIEKMATQYFTSASVLPSTYFDYSHLQASVHSATAVLAQVKNCAAITPLAGIAASSIVNGSTINVKVDVTATRDRQYYLAVFVTEDGIVAPQASGGPDYIHNHVLRGFLTDEKSFFGDDLGTISVNGQVSKEYTVNLADYNAESCALACMVLYKDGNSWVVTNSISVPMYNGIVDYRFEE